jgi:hypothetical protein
LKLYILRKGGERREGRVIQGIDSFWALLYSWLFFFFFFEHRNFYSAYVHFTETSVKGATLDTERMSLAGH